MIRAKYTVVLKTLLDEEQTNGLIQTALQDYPMYEPTNPATYTLIPTREQLNKKILDHYKYREIGFETVGRFIDELRITMNEIMPYYYQMYKSADVLNGVDDPFGNVDIVETYDETITGKSTGKSNNTSKTNSESTSDTTMNDNSKTVHTTTPQTNVNIAANDIESVPYADDINWNQNSSNSTGTNKDNADTTSSGSSEGTSEGKTSHTLTRKGNQGVNTYAHDLKELRETFNNIEQMIINDKRLSELFMLVF